jgi:glyoxylase-like metal-dependent hydrolase (beta-lactamase superfamily II)
MRREATPTVEKITSAIHRIELPLPMDGLTVVNCYAIVGDRGISLIDPGWSTPEGEAALLVALAALGAERGDVRRTLVTHAHPDHFTLAVEWQADYGIPIHLGAPERPSVEAFEGTQFRFPRQAELLVLAGDRALASQVAALPLRPYEQTMRFAPAAVWLKPGQDLDCEGVQVVAHSTPGHTSGHVVFEEVSSGSLFTGDHVLPRITPAIGLELRPEDAPLRSYLGSLEATLERPDGTMLSAHGAVHPSVHERTRELLSHHEARFEAILDHVTAGLRTATEVAVAMPWTSHDKALRDLDEVHQMTAIIETLYHLDELVHRGVLARTMIDDVAHHSAPA